MDSGIGSSISALPITLWSLKMVPSLSFLISQCFFFVGFCVCFREILLISYLFFLSLSFVLIDLNSAVFVLDCISEMWCENQMCVYLVGSRFWSEINLESFWILNWSDLVPTLSKLFQLLACSSMSCLFLSADRLVPLSLSFVVARGGGGGGIPGFS